MKRFWQLLFLFSSFLLIHNRAFAQDDQTEEVKRFLHQLYNARIQLLVDQQHEHVQPFYLPANKLSRLSFEHEKNRAVYINDWAKARNVKFVHSSGEIRIIRVRQNGNTARVSLVHSLQLTYRYPTQELHSMGIGTRHVLTLKKQDGKWHVLKEWYLDPLNENSSLIPASKPLQLVQQDDTEYLALSSQSRRQKYNRAKAVQYAEKYAGLANKPGRSQRYNQKYIDYTYQGGDCTNFTSQVLGDKEEGGGLPMKHGWRYKYNQGGTVAWVRTDSFKNFLIHSGYGTLIARGAYDEVAKPTKKFPQSALALLQPGDVIGYEMNGDVDHFSVVTARDIKRYVLVNSHTADRYHVPWDLGWDKNTKFLLFRIRD
ncbi:amidase domain-containing protein [Brevibacillus borstelensis]|uniref:amidase domain-containing protein n=1 Tax=Brevibacillus borstelensis TaxID=45462 RepID=UPI0030C36574